MSGGFLCAEMVCCQRNCILKLHLETYFLKKVGFNYLFVLQISFSEVYLHLLGNYQLAIQMALTKS